ncbi:MAG: efflux RND transporter permease subunit [Planctomycetota bacterium]
MTSTGTPATPAPDAPESAPQRYGFARRLVARPVTLMMLFLTLAGTGVLSYLRIPLTLLPRGLSSSNLNVSLPYPGAGPLEVEDQLTRPVEEALRTIPGIVEIVSYSSENFATINVEFSSRTDMDVAYGEVRDRIERIRAELPPQMDRYRIRRWNTNTDMPVMWIGVQYDPDARDPFFPIEKIAVPRIEGVDGVARVGLGGVVDEAVRIFVDVEKSRGYGVNLGEVIRGLQGDNFTLPAGQIDEGDRTFALRVDSRLRSADELRAWPIGNGLVLGDIAEIVRARAYRDTVWRINGRPAVGLDISRESDENTIAVCDRVEAVIDELRADPRMSGISFNIFWNQKKAILEAIGGLKSSALWGGIFAVVVLWIFLRDIRLTLVAALAIPSSLLAALAAVHFGGGTLNLISLVGFTLGIGMLVDNAVVVIENIARRRALGDGTHEAAATGAGEVGLAVLASTMTSVVVFLPLVFMDGDRNTRIMMREVGLPISWSLIASLVVALVFIPTFTARVMGRKRRGNHAEAIGVGTAGGRLANSYSAALAWVLRHRFASLLLLVALFVLSLQAKEAVPASQSGNDGGDSLSLEVEVPSTYLLADTNKVFQSLERWANEHMESIGFDFYSSRFDRFSGSLDLYAREDLPRAEVDTMDDRVRAVLPELPGVELTLGREAGGSAAKELRVDLQGPDFGELARIAEDLRRRLVALNTEQDGKLVPLLDIVRTDIERGLDEVHVRVDRERASELGVLPETVEGVVAWGLSGQRLPDLQEGEREVRMQIEYGQTDEESLDFLRNLGLPRLAGGTVPLASVASLEFGKAVGTLVRRNGRTTTGLSAVPGIDNLYLVSSSVAEVLAAYPFPEGVTWSEEGGRREFEADMEELFHTLLLSVALVYLVMAILLESMIVPLSILLSIPLASMGVDFALFATGFPMDEMVFIGLILLAGVVVNNAIVLLDRVQRLRREGVERSAALLQGGADRLRPILMTALTTIFGLLPMAVPHWFPGDGSGGYESMAVTVGGGLAFSTLLTLFVVPLFYTYFDDLSVAFARLSPWRARATAPQPEAPSM